MVTLKWQIRIPGDSRATVEYLDIDEVVHLWMSSMDSAYKEWYSLAVI